MAAFANATFTTACPFGQTLLSPNFNHIILNASHVYLDLWKGTSAASLCKAPGNQSHTGEVCITLGHLFIATQARSSVPAVAHTAGGGS